MQYKTIPQLSPYPLSQLQDEDLLEVAFWNGTAFISCKITGAVIKAAVSGGAVWGSITGDIENQTDLVLILDSKFDNPTGTLNDYIAGDGSIQPLPTIPDPQVNSDWDATTGVAEILNKPTSLPPNGAAGGDLDGSYPNPTLKESVELTGVPTAPTAAVNTDSPQIATTAFVIAQIEQAVDSDIPFVSATEQRRGIQAQNGSTTLNVFNGITTTATGSTFAITTQPASQVQFPRTRFYTIGGSTNQQAGIIVSGGASFQNLSRGFRFQAMFTPSDQSTGGTEWYVPGARQFIGLADSLSLVGISSTVAVQSLTNIIGVGSDQGDPYLSIFHNDILGNAQKTSLGVGFPANKASAVNFPDVFYVEFYNRAGSNLVAYRVTNLLTNDVAGGTLSNNLPIPTARLVPQIVRTSGSTSQNVSIDVGCLIVSSLF